MMDDPLVSGVLRLMDRAEQCCGNCAHANDEAALLPSLNTYCTHRLGFYNGKLMEKSARCEKWVARMQEREAIP